MWLPDQSKRDVSQYSKFRLAMMLICLASSVSWREVSKFRLAMMLICLAGLAGEEVYGEELLAECLIHHLSMNLKLRNKVSRKQRTLANCLPIDRGFVFMKMAPRPISIFQIVL